MMNFGPVIGAAAIPSSFAVAPAIDLTVVLAPLAWAAAGIVAVLLLGRLRRAVDSPARIVDPTSAPLTA